jgi:membrane-associated protease RseP (regulator of RpoE activity)
MMDESYAPPQFEFPPRTDAPQFEPARFARPSRPRVLLPLFLFCLTCYSTWSAQGFAYALAVMTILLCHEFGHFLQALRHRVPASLPYFIPMPVSPVGTMGAVIVMQPGRGDLRALFDIGISGPLAGLVPSLIFSLVGLQLSHVAPVQAQPGVMMLGEPLLFKFMSHAVFGNLPPGYDVYLHPIAFAGWVGIFITALNMIPIGQLDGGHVLYALLRRRAHRVAQALLFAAMMGVVVFGYWGWSLMILLLMLMGPIHPPTANDDVPLGTGRTILGWASLLFVVIGFTPSPFTFST